MVNRLLSQLKCRLQRVDTPIIKQGDPIEKVYFFYQGSGVLQREFDSKAYGNACIDVVNLPEGSFFGELAVLLNLKAYFHMKAGSGKKKKVLMRKGQQVALIYEIDAEGFLDLINDYPEYAS